MKVVRVSEHVWQLGIWIFFPMHVWLVRGEGGVTLIDTGISPMTGKILKAVDSLGQGPLKRILLTHCHSDHVGSLKNILATKKVPVYANRIEIPYGEGKEVYPGRKKAQKLVEPGIITPLVESSSKELFEIDGIIPFHTPGHTPGHTIYLHKEDGVLLCGDLFTEKGGKLNRPMPSFTSDMAEAIKSGKIVHTLKPAVVCMSHGKLVKECFH